MTLCYVLHWFKILYTWFYILFFIVATLTYIAHIDLITLMSHNVPWPDCVNVKSWLAQVFISRLCIWNVGTGPLTTSPAPFPWRSVQFTEWMVCVCVWITICRINMMSVPWSSSCFVGHWNWSWLWTETGIKRWQTTHENKQDEIKRQRQCTDEGLNFTGGSELARKDRRKTIGL